MSSFISNKKYNGTLERAVALILQSFVVHAGNNEQGVPVYTLRNHKDGLDGIAVIIAKQLSSEIASARDCLENLLKVYEYDAEDIRNDCWDEARDVLELLDRAIGEQGNSTEIEIDTTAPCAKEKS